MKIRIRVTDADRERLGVEQEWVEADPYSLSLNETIVLQKGVEVEGVICSYDSANAWRNALSADDSFAWKVLFWLGLRRAGIKAPLGEFDATIIGWEQESDPVDPGEPGKDPSTPETTS